MIERMKVVCVVSTLEKKRELLLAIRKLGVLHVSEKKKADSVLISRFDELSRTEMFLKEYPEASYENKVLSSSRFEKLHNSVVKSLDEKKIVLDEKNKLSLNYERIKEWGAFDPESVERLKEDGVELHFYKIGKKELNQLDEMGVSYIRLSDVDKMPAIAVIGDISDKKIPANQFVLPEMGLDELSERIELCDKKLSSYEEVFKKAAAELGSYKKAILDCKNSISYSSVSNSSSEDGDLVWLCGYIPEDCEVQFRKTAVKNNWAFIIDDPEDEDELVPTKVKYSKVSRLMQPVFDILGTVPGYHEYDISFYFLCFFSLFFAMIIGDAGYGMVFLALAVLLRVKQKQFTNLSLLVLVVSLTTIVWGAITGTWFGLESAMNVGILRFFVVRPLANYPEAFGCSSISQQNMMMKLCFIIGTVQLTLACVMSIRRKWSMKDDSWIADAGWLISINSLYYVVLFLVIGENVNLIPFACFIGVGFVLVSLFGGMAPGVSFSDGLKAGLGDIFTNFLNTISAFGNIMSYIRLFAVGLASLAIAQSFNGMAGGLTGIMRILSVLIFAIGHVLNLVMGLLSVVVHGVRLNLLEFSGQLGMEWSGTLYEPFKVEEK